MTPTSDRQDTLRSTLTRVILQCRSDSHKGRVGASLTALLASIALVAAGLVATAAPAVAADCASTVAAPNGAGTSSGDPYLITNLAELTYVRDQVNSGNSYSGRFLELTQDITANCRWTSGIGTDGSTPFSGTFEGAGYAILGLDIEASGGSGLYTGLFAYAVNAAIANVGFTGNVSAIHTLSGGGPYIGALVGRTFGTTIIRNSYSTGAVTCGDGTVDQQCFAGGLVGSARDGQITNSFATGKVTLDQHGPTSSNGGGLAGFTDGTVITDSYATGDVEVSSGSGYFIGGLVGEVNRGSVTRTYSVGAVTGSIQGTGARGGLIGSIINSPTVDDSSYWDQTVNSDPTIVAYGIGQVGRVLSTGTDTNATPQTTTQLQTLVTYSSTAWTGKIASGWSSDESTTPWGICATVNSGYPFLNVFYATDPCTPASPTPTFDTPVATADGFTVNVTNYDANYTWTPTVDAGSVSAGMASGTTLPLTVTGLAAGASATVTMTTSRSGYTNGSATVSDSSISNALTPTFDTPVATSGGFTVNVTNYDANYTWTPSVTTGSVSAGTASGSTLPLTVTGLSAGASDTITMLTTRSSYADGVGTVTGTSLVARATASPSLVSFGLQNVGTTSNAQTITITSSGTSNLVIGAGATSLTGAAASMFSIDTDNCSGQTLAPSSTCTILVSFAPTSEGEQAATLNLVSNDPNSPTTITLTGGEVVIPPAKTFTFWFNTSDGGTCLDSVQVIDTHVYQLPSADAACVPEGSELVGWSIPGQSWNFAPGAEVVVSGSQTFTAVALAPDIAITYDSNVSRGTKCSFGRKSLVIVPRDGNFAEWTYCMPKGYELAGWTDSTLRDDATVYEPGEALPESWFTRGTSPMNTIHLYAMWKWVG